MNFDRLQMMVDELNSTNSSSEKQDILSMYPDMQTVLEYTYNPYKMFGVTSKMLKKRSDITSTSTYTDLFDLLDALYTREITGHDAIAQLNGFIAEHNGYSELIYRILDKDLKTRAGDKLINKAFPGLVPTFNVTLAKNYKDHANKVTFDGTWLESRKLDGIRVTTRIENGTITFLSRNGKEFTTLDVVRNEIERLGLPDGVLDGEMCITDEDGNEDFTAIVGAIKRKTEQVDHPRYKVFDTLTLQEFDDEKGNVNLLDRLQRLDFQGSTIVTFEEQTPLFSEAQFEEAVAEASRQGWEGVMLRKNVEYVGKRTADLLKVKKFNDFEIKVESIESGPFRIIDKDSGLETTIETLTNVIVKYKGYNVSVGSGFSLEERQRYYDNPDLIIGKEITVQYFSESVNRDGDISLRFPTFKHNWGENRNI